MFSALITIRTPVYYTSYDPHYYTCVPLQDFWDGLHPANDTAYQSIYSAYIYAARATKLIAAHDPDSSPFFLYLAMQNVHWPLQVPARFLAEDKSPGQVCTAHQTPETCNGRGDDDCGCQHSCYCNRRLKLGMVAALDEVVANVTAALKANGMWERTVFWMVSDNGGETMDAGNNAPLRGSKFLYYEGGLRSPALIGGPLVAPRWRGQTYSTMVHNTDILPTLCALANVTPLPADANLAGIDGISLAGDLFVAAATEHDAGRGKGVNNADRASRGADRELWLAPDVLRVGK